MTKRLPTKDDTQEILEKLKKWRLEKTLHLHQKIFYDEPHENLEEFEKNSDMKILRILK